MYHCSKLLPTCRFEVVLYEYLYVYVPLLFLSILSAPISSGPWFYIPSYTLIISKSISSPDLFPEPQVHLSNHLFGSFSLLFSQTSWMWHIQTEIFLPQTLLDQAKNFDPFWLSLPSSTGQFFRNFYKNISQTWLWPSSLMVQVTIFSHLDYSITF